MPAQANPKNSAVKRIMQEAKELSSDQSEEYVAAPLEDNLFEWHATVRGRQGTDFEGGVYHLRILLPSTYPFQAPDILLLTPNGRFETNKKICIDGLTSFHEGSWQPAWGVRTAVVGLMGFWNERGEALQSHGAVDYPREEKKRLAGLSGEWKCAVCESTCAEMLPPSSLAPTPTAAASSSSAALVDDVSPPPAQAPPPAPVNNDVPTPSSSELISLLSPTSPNSSLPPAAVDPPPSSSPSAPVSQTVIESPHHPLSSLPPHPPPALLRSDLRRSHKEEEEGPGSPLWLDALLGVVLSVVVVLIARRMV